MAPCEDSLRGSKKSDVSVKISIVLAAYNGEQFIREQLDSFVAQTRPPDELVVCDDDSRDSTWDLLTAFAESAPFPVRLHRNERNLGYAANFAKAIGCAEGDLIFLSDQDDVWLPTKISRMTAAFDRSDVLVATCDQEATDGSMNPSGQSVLSQVRAIRADQDMFTIGCCTAMRSSFRDLMLPLPDGVTAHDIWIDVLAKSLDVHVTVPEVLQYHRRHATNASPGHLISASRVSRVTLLRRVLDISPDQKAFLYPYYEATMQRLEQVPESSLPPGVDRQNGLVRARRQLEALRAREAIASLPRRRRLQGVLRLLRGGAYQQFSGWRSVAKDLLARRVPG
jgi:glycosyltransferase involved in cell wall biosynthesis